MKIDLEATWLLAVLALVFALLAIGIGANQAERQDALEQRVQRIEKQIDARFMR